MKKTIKTIRQEDDKRNIDSFITKDKKTQGIDKGVYVGLNFDVFDSKEPLSPGGDFPNDVGDNENDADNIDVIKEDETQESDNNEVLDEVVEETKTEETENGENVNNEISDETDDTNKTGGEDKENNDQETESNTNKDDLEEMDIGEDKQEFINDNEEGLPSNIDEASNNVTDHDDSKEDTDSKDEVKSENVSGVQPEDTPPQDVDQNDNEEMEVEDVADPITGEKTEEGEEGEEKTDDGIVDESSSSDEGVVIVDDTINIDASEDTPGDDNASISSILQDAENIDASNDSGDKENKKLTKKEKRAKEIENMFDGDHGRINADAGFTEDDGVEDLVRSTSIALQQNNKSEDTFVLSSMSPDYQDNTIKTLERLASFLSFLQKGIIDLTINVSFLSFTLLLLAVSILYVVKSNVGFSVVGYAATGLVICLFLRYLSGQVVEEN